MSQSHAGTEPFRKARLAGIETSEPAIGVAGDTRNGNSTSEVMIEFESLASPDPQKRSRSIIATVEGDDVMEHAPPPKQPRICIDLTDD